MKIAVIGAAGSIGQTLSLLLKNHLPAGSELFLYDIDPIVLGVAVDLSHIPRSVIVKGYSGDDLTSVLDGADIVLIAAGIARKLGMDRSDLFNINADIIYSLSERIANTCPKAFIGIITNPLNSTVAIVAEVFKANGVYDKKRLFGITTLDILRSETFIAELKGQDPISIRVSVIGGHSGVTILPLLSQVEGIEFTAEEVKVLIHRIQNAGTEVVEAKAGGGSATLSMGQAACRFCLSLVRAAQGEKGVIECAYVEGDGKYARFFAQSIRLSQDGVEETLDHGLLSVLEQDTLDNMLETLRQDIKMGVEFVK
ncbi:malate dehydrogenase [Candidatus Enterovibrio escicola]|uniref:malate dehydrogenase n=1 Tax=Candidatus Enterovibrio escicola TaxID=1927127 RepID=UPI001237A16D|nr:malate dehydrogenase [Candidatus Enterovibrio escacola]